MLFLSISPLTPSLLRRTVEMLHLVATLVSSCKRNVADYCNWSCWESVRATWCIQHSAWYITPHVNWNSNVLNDVVSRNVDFPVPESAKSVCFLMSSQVHWASRVLGTWGAACSCCWGHSQNGTRLTWCRGKRCTVLMEFFPLCIYTSIIIIIIIIIIYR